MNKLFFLIILLLFTSELCAQCFEERNKYETYYKENISTLNDLEGFWSVTLNAKLYLNGELINQITKSQISEWAIIKYGTSFRACHKYGGYPYDSKLVFIPTTNSNIYLYNKEKDGEITTANAIMTATGLLEYTYETNQNDLKLTWKDKYQKGLREIQEFKWIKTYPTQEMAMAKQKSSGTGFALSENGLIVTCNHVIENSGKIIVKGINGDFNKSYKVKIVSTDKHNDLALLQIVDSEFTKLGKIPYLLTEKIIDVGSTVFALGFPLRSTMGDEIKLTNGIISSRSGFKGDVTTYQISVPVQPGNSGGPLFDEKGNLVGIINAKNILAQNASYAIKTSYLKGLIESLPSNVKLNTLNTLSSKSLPEKVKILRNYIYIIETN